MLSFIRVLGLLAIVIPVAATAQTAERSLTVEIEAIVKSVDAETREIVLEDPETGETELIVAGPEVKNFDQIAVGDDVKAQVTLGLTARMALPEEKDSIMAVEGRAAEGATPGAVDAVAVTRVLELVEYDAETFVATLRDQEGLQRTVFVESDVGRAFVSGLSAGDSVAVTYFETVAIGIVEN